MNHAVVEVTQELIGELLHIPDGSKVVALHLDPLKNTLLLKLQGDCFPDTPEGELLPRWECYVSELREPVTKEDGTETVMRTLSYEWKQVPFNVVMGLRRYWEM